MSSQQNRARNLFLFLCAGCLLVVVIFAVVRNSRTSPVIITAEKTAPAPVPPSSGPQTESTEPDKHSSPAEAPAPADAAKGDRAPMANAPPARGNVISPLLYFRANALGDFYGRLAVAPLDAFDQVRYASTLSCDRVHFANKNGVCLASDRGVFTTYSAVMFDEQLRPGWTKKLNGIPSRVRVSPSGKLAAITVFLSGHSYTSTSFSTETTIMDVGAGNVITDLEKFSVSRNGAPFQSPDFNFWGVSFAHDENRFFATLSTKGKTYLVECDLAKRSAKVIHEDVECPSLSPDNSRIAFKKRTGPITWRIWLLELKALTERPLGETRNVDDQVEWLDNEHVLYALPENSTGASPSTDLWSLPIRAGLPPELLMKGAFSPAVVQR